MSPFVRRGDITIVNVYNNISYCTPLQFFKRIDNKAQANYNIFEFTQKSAGIKNTRLFSIQKNLILHELRTMYSTQFHLPFEHSGKIITVQNKLQLFFLIKNLKKFSILSSCSGKINHCKSCQIGTQGLAPGH